MSVDQDKIDYFNNLEEEHNQFIRDESHNLWDIFIQPMINSGDIQSAIKFLEDSNKELTEKIQEIAEKDKKLFFDLKKQVKNSEDFEFLYKLFVSFKHSDNYPVYKTFKQNEFMIGRLKMIKEGKNRNDSFKKINLERISILDVINNLGFEIKKSGKNLMIKCPFHADSNPSLSITSDKNLFHCFGCQTSGNAIQFIMLYLNYSFKEALAWIEQKGLSP